MDIKIGRNDWLVAAGLVIAIFLAYMPCWNGEFLFDDDVLLWNNPVLKPGGLAKVWQLGGYLNYWPLTSTVYWIEFHLWGLRPLGYHLVNLALHSLSALLLWRVLLRLRVPGAMFAAALFALHPVNVESAAWIAQLKGLLSLSLALVSVLFYLGYEQQGGRWRYGLAVVAFQLSALAKGIALTLPVVLLACAWWQRGRIDRRDLIRVLPYFLIAAVMAVVEVWAQHFIAGGVSVRSDGFFSRAAVAGCALWFYLGKLIWPVDLCPVYPLWSIDEHSMLSYLPGVLWVGLLAWAWWRRRTWGRPVVMLIVCYTALLLPALGFVNITFMQYSLVTDHWQYVATVVPCAVLAGVMATQARRFVGTLAAVVASVVMVAALAVLSFHQAGIYADGETFYEATLRYNPDFTIGHNNLAVALASRGQVEAAIAQYEKALDIAPGDAEANYNLGDVLAHRGEIDAAIDHYQRALASKPDYAEAHCSLGNALVDRGQVDLAISHYQEALKIKPDYAEAQSNLGVALVARGQIDSAIGHYQKALEIKPEYAEAHFNLANALLGRGQTDSAIAHYQRALEIKPDYFEAHCNLGNALMVRGEPEEAIAQYEKALEIKSGSADVQSNLATALAGRGDLDSAIVHYQRAIEIAPNNIVARRNLALVVAEREKILKTLAEQREAVRLHPNDASLLNSAAWTLATNPNASVRNGVEAIELAQRAAKLPGIDQPTVLGTLAAAYADAGRFPEAVRTAEQAERLATAAGNRALAEEIHSRLELFRSGQPYRQPPSR